MTSLFIDSGAHSLYTKKVINKNHQDGYNFYETDEFWNYVDQYALFIKEHIDSIDVFVNVDVIFNPKLSWKVYRYLKNKYSLNSLPVVHYGTELKWLKRYMNDTDYIGIGGLGQEVTSSQYIWWADGVFTLLCDNKDRIPGWKTHGFAMTSHKLIMRYPWYSIDSTSWLMTTSMGYIIVPVVRNNKFDYMHAPMKVYFGNKKDNGPYSFNRKTPLIQKMILNYIEQKGYTKEQVKDSYIVRNIINCSYYRDLEKVLPKWPHPFKVERCGFLQ